MNTEKVAGVVAYLVGAEQDPPFVWGHEPDQDEWRCLRRSIKGAIRDEVLTATLWLRETQAALMDYLGVDARVVEGVEVFHKKEKKNVR